MKDSIAAIQAIANLFGAGLKVDGIVGRATRAGIKAIPNEDLKNVDALLASAGKESVKLLVSPPASHVPKNDWDLLVEEVSRKAPKVGLNPTWVVAQLALESGWGKNVPKVGGISSYNFGGIKANSVQQVSGVTTPTLEHINGTMVRTHAEWAVFESVGHFVDMYHYYLLEGPSSYRYKRPFNKVGDLTSAQTGREFANILKAGGYATDPNYPDLVVSVIRSVERRHGGQLA